MDYDIERLFDKQMKMKSKNEEMITNKISDLNAKPILRDYLFKNVSDQQLQEDTDEIK